MYYRWQEDTLFLECSIQTRAGEDRIVGQAGNHLRIRLNAVPADGKANKHLIKFLAATFKVKQSAITIVSGQSSRQKRLSIQKPGRIPDVLQEVTIHE